MIIQSDKAKIKIDGYSGKLDFMAEYIPLARIASGTEYDAQLDVKHSPDFALEIAYPYVRMQSENDIEIIAMAEHILERARQEKGTYCLHASSASFAGKGVLFMGAVPDIGKTSLAMLAGEQGRAFISDEKTLLSGLNIVGGINTIKMRKAWQQKYGSGLVSASSMYDTATTAQASAIVVPYIDHGKTEVTVWPKDKAFWHLQEELSRKIRGVSRLTDDFQTLAPSLDTDSLARKRIAYARHLAESVPVYAIRGTPEQIISSLEEALYLK